MMDTRIKVTFDGTGFQPAEPLPPGLRPGDAAEVVIANGKPAGPPPAADPDPQLGQPGSFLRAVAEAQLDGPPDWSTSLRGYASHGPG